MLSQKGRIAKRITVLGIAAMLTVSGMGMEVQAKETTLLPSAGIDFFLASNATSVKNLMEEETSQNKELPEVLSEAKPSASASATTSALASASASIFKSATASEQATASPDEEPAQEKVIEETVIVSSTKTVNEKEREIAAKKEEEGFKSLVIAKVNDYVNVRSIPSEEGEILGKLYDKSVGEFISEKDGWYEITSGSVTGYVKAEYCVTGEAAVELAKKVGTRIATVNTTTLKVREEPGMDAVVLGLIPINDQLLVTEELDGWVKVNIEEGDGYVSLDYVTLSTEFVEAESKEEEEARLAKEEAERKAALKAAQEAAARAARSEASTSSNSSESTGAQEVITPAVTSGSGSELGKAVADYAVQFVGNPYVWGGTSLTNGADCSGFVMSVYANFGVSLPHSSSADRSVGAAVSGLDNAQPGDIVCYSGHVGLYIGGGQIVHASTSRTGIIISNANYRSILSIRRIF